MRNAWDTNPDGAGIAYVADGQVHIDKGHMTFEAFTEAYNKVPKVYPRVVHFRYATLGVINAENTHPFHLNKSGAAMFHNGPCVSDSFDGDNQRSDSRHFAEDLMGHLDAYTIKHLKPVWEGFIESGNKLVMLYADGHMDIINEKLGTWKKGVWLSNTYSIEPPLMRKPAFSTSKWADDDTLGTPIEVDTPVLIYQMKDDKVEAVHSFYPDWQVGDYYSYTYSESLDTMLENWAKTGTKVKYVFNSLDSYVTDLMDEYAIDKYTPPVVKPTLTTVKPHGKVVTQSQGRSRWKWDR
jgi:predicted glutamine amidotransferase